MSDTLLSADDPILASDFMVEMLRQMRALDSYGVWEGKSAAEVLDPFILTKD